MRKPMLALAVAVSAFAITVAGASQFGVTGPQNATPARMPSALSVVYYNDDTALCDPGHITITTYSFNNFLQTPPFSAYGEQAVLGINGTGDQGLAYFKAQSDRIQPMPESAYCENVYVTIDIEYWEDAAHTGNGGLTKHLYMQTTADSFSGDGTQAAAATDFWLAFNRYHTSFNAGELYWGKGTPIDAEVFTSIDADDTENPPLLSGDAAGDAINVASWVSTTVRLFSY